MDLQSVNSTKPEAERDNTDAKVSRLAARTWLALQAIEVPPTPQNFGLWYTYLSGENAELTQRMDKLLQPGRRPEPAMLDLIYTECVGGPEDSRFEVIEDGAETMEHVVQETTSQLAAGQRYLQDYSRVLAGVGTQLGDQQTLERLVETVRTLVAETTRASELNRSLQARLQTSATQVQRLRQSLVEVRQNATTDALTGLLNRREFDARLKRAVARRKLDSIPVCLLIADVDRFKAFNDTFGHK
ncbi:MAG: diguanylate cyclase, partial [Hymenobacter sp.]